MNYPGYVTWLQAKERFVWHLDFTAWKFCVPTEISQIRAGKWLWGEGWLDCEVEWPTAMVWGEFTPWTTIERRVGPDGHIEERNIEIVLEEGEFVFADRERDAVANPSVEEGDPSEVSSESEEIW